MSNWVRFSDRHPTMADADCDGKVVILHNNKQFGHVFLEMKEAEIKCGDFDDCHWLENLPPFPRTLEDVARDMVDRVINGVPITKPYAVPSALIEEMKEILERKDKKI